VNAGAASYMWSTGETTECITVNTAGIYSVVVIDVNGCSSSCEAAVILNLLPECLITGNAFIWLGQSTGLCVPSGAADYLWSTGETTNCISVSAEGIYSVTVIHVGGCISTCSLTVNIIPNNAPIVDVDGLIILECVDLVPNIFPTFIDPDGDLLTINCTEEILDNVCGYSIIRSCTATDPCGATVTATIQIDVTDTQAPLFEVMPAILSLPCDEWGPFYYPSATDICDDSVAVELVSFYELSGDCSLWWLATFIATDDCGNTSTIEVLLELFDTPPVFEDVPAILSISCEDWGPDMYPSATDDCSENVVVELVSFLELSGGCSTWWLATFTATDDCENDTTIEVLVNLFDTAGPTIFNVPADQYLECGDAIPPVPLDVFATDECTEAVTLDFLETEGGDICEAWIMRTWTAVDSCGNITVSFYTIYFTDTEAPVLSNSPEDFVMDCGEPFPDEEILTAWDECQGAIEVVFTQTEGPLPAGDCILLTPQMVGTDWSLILMEFMGGTAFFTLQEGLITTGPGTSAQITATLVSSTNPNGGFYLTLDLTNGVDWNTWSNMAWATSYKDDGNFAGDNYLDWIFYLISNTSNLVGWGDYEGSLLNLEHAPSNLYYGYQLGLAANNMTAGFGSGGWTTYSGTFIDSSQDINTFVSGGSDLAFEHDCTGGTVGCPEYTIINTWTATDVCGNVAVEEQVITVGPVLISPTPSPCPGDLSGDGLVNIPDILLFNSSFGCSGLDCGAADLNNDGSVNVSDMLILVAYFGMVCE